MAPGKVPYFNGSVIRTGAELQICPAEAVLKKKFEVRSIAIKNTRKSKKFYS